MQSNGLDRNPVIFCRGAQSPTDAVIRRVEKPLEAFAHRHHLQALNPQGFLNMSLFQKSELRPTESR